MSQIKKKSTRGGGGLRNSSEAESRKISKPGGGPGLDNVSNLPATSGQSASTTCGVRKDVPQTQALDRGVILCESHRKCELKKAFIRLQGLADAFRTARDENKHDYVEQLQEMMALLGIDIESEDFDRKLAHVLRSLEASMSGTRSSSSESESESPDVNIEDNEKYDFEESQSSNDFETVPLPVDEDQDSEDEEKPPVKPRIPCYSCRKNRCSNCLVKIEKGDRKFSKIPSQHHVVSTSDFVTLEVALTCIFDPKSPYMKWVRVMEVKADDPNSSNGNGTNEKLVENGKKNEDLPTTPFENVTELVDTVEQNKAAADGDQIPAPEEKNIQEDSDTPSNFEFTTRMLGEMVWSSNVSLPDFYLCRGCAELLTVLFSVWEGVESRKIDPWMYFHLVMLGFTNAKEAQNVIYRPPRRSKMNNLKRGTKTSHPKGCQRRTSRTGVMIQLETPEDLIKNAVGNLHSFLHEAYCRVYNEIVKDLIGADDDDKHTVWG